MTDGGQAEAEELLHELNQKEGGFGKLRGRAWICNILARRRSRPVSNWGARILCHVFPCRQKSADFDRRSHLWSRQGTNGDRSFNEL